MRNAARFIPHGVVVLFVCTVLGIALHHAHPFALYALVTESSAGTWVSSMLLVAGATVALLLSSSHNKRFLWLLLAVLLLALAADERFMIHEYVKRTVLFTPFGGNWKRVGCIDEIPMVLVALAGGVFSFWLFRIRQSNVSRALFTGAVVSGVVSVSLDVLSSAPVIEEICKLAAELLLVIWLFEMYGRSSSAGGLPDKNSTVE